MRLDDVWLRYHRRGAWVLRGVNVAAAPGSIAVVLGRNGAGKSTLLQLAAGVLRPSRGAVRDRPAVVGWVPERFPADQPVPVRGYLLAMGAVRGMTGPDLAGAVAHWTERLGLTAFLEVKLPDLSKGTAQKVGLAQALLCRPDLLILDEPWEGLDAAARDLVPDIVGELTEAGSAVLVSDHRGETARLPGAAHWSVADGEVTVGRPAASTRCVIEVEVAADQAPATAERLRAQGHQVVRVRPAPGAVAGVAPPQVASWQVASGQVAPPRVAP